MDGDILFRFTLTLAIITAGLSIYWLINRWLLGRARAGDLFTTRPNKTMLVYFTTPSCAPCKTVQWPAIQQVSRQLGERFQIVEIDAAERPDLARSWGVMSVPTTFVIDARGKARYVNNGIARADKLLKQIQAV
jgi:thiol-disulfide isomerase/thioredoxin